MVKVFKNGKLQEEYCEDDEKTDFKVTKLKGEDKQYYINKFNGSSKQLKTSENPAIIELAKESGLEEMAELKEILG